MQAYAAPIKSTVAQVYAEHGFSLDSTATTAGTTAGDVWQALGAQKPTLTDPTPEVASLALAAGTADDTCTITITFPAVIGKQAAHCYKVPARGLFLYAKVQALTAPIKSTISQVYSEKGGCLVVAGTTNAAATYTVGGEDIKDELGSQAPLVEDPTAEVSLLQTGVGTADGTCTITMTTKKLGINFSDAAQTITFTGDFSVNPISWAAAPSAGITGNAAAVIDTWR